MFRYFLLCSLALLLCLPDASYAQKKKPVQKKLVKKTNTAKPKTVAKKKPTSTSRKKVAVKSRKSSSSRTRSASIKKPQTTVPAYQPPAYFEPMYNPPLDERPLPPVLSSVEQKPQFDGDLNEYLRHSIQYPDTNRLKVKEGTVMVKFLVTLLGDIRNPTIVGPIDPLLDEEALRVVKEMPRWNPARHKGLFANTYYTLPVEFRLY